MVGGGIGAGVGLVAGPVGAAAGGVLGSAVAAWFIGGAVAGAVVGGGGTRAFYGASQSKALKSLDQVQDEVTKAEEQVARAQKKGILVTVYENERLGNDGTWSNANCTSRPRYTDEFGEILPSPEDTNSQEGWVWTDPWRIADCRSI